MEKLFNETEARIIGCLIEKERATPDNYPLSLNSLVTACNQKTARKPVMDLSPAAVESALEGLRLRGFAGREQSAGSRVAKFRHAMVEKLNFTDSAVAAVCVLLLRGPQTIGEIKTHCNRLYNFHDTDEVAQTLDKLGNAEPPYVVELPKLPGQKEARFTHCMSGEIDLEAMAEAAQAPSAARSSAEMLVEELREELSALREEHETLRSEFNDFKQQFE